MTAAAQPEIERTALSAAELTDMWPVLSPDERVEAFRALDRSESDDLFLSMSSQDQATLLLGLPGGERRLWMRLLPPDDAVDVLQELPEESRGPFFDMLDAATRQEVTALLAYAEDEAGGLMNPRFARIRPDMNVEEAIRYLRRQARRPVETIYYAYVLDRTQRLCGVVSFRELFSAPGDRKVEDMMRTDVVTVPEDMDQEQVSRIISAHDFMALPVVDGQGRMKGIVTIDDIVDVVQEEATEDIHKLGGMEALEDPYLQTGFLAMLKKRAGWLAILFVGEIFTASAMGAYQDEIASAVILALFVPLIISSGGNSGSQASTLVIRAMALGEVRLKDWWRVMKREIVVGLALGAILAGIGFLRVAVWEGLFGSYGPTYLLVAMTVAASLIGVVLWGTLTGSMLPFLLRKLRLDPASASAPFVATLVDVLGLIIYFTVAQIFLSGTLL